MKNNKWIWWTLTILLTLVILIGVGGAGFRMGAMQGANISQNANGAAPFFGHAQRMDGNFNDKRGNPHLQGFDHPQMREFDRGFNRGMGRGGFSPLFGFVHLAFLGLLLWAGYKLLQKSGWRLTRNAATTPVTSGTSSVGVDEKKE